MLGQPGELGTDLTGERPPDRVGGARVPRGVLVSPSRGQQQVLKQCQSGRRRSHRIPDTLDCVDQCRMSPKTLFEREDHEAEEPQTVRLELALVRDADRSRCRLPGGLDLNRPSARLEIL